MTYTLYLASVALMCFFTKEEAEHYVFDLSQVHPEMILTVLAN